MSSSAVYIRSAELGAPFTDKPEISLRDAMSNAATRAIASAGLQAGDIDALFVAAMGSFEHEQFMGNLPLRLANQLSLRADVAPMMIGSSETGAWALRSAFQALRRDDRQDHVLIVAGEQMNPLVSERATTPEALFAERVHRNRTISQVVDEADRKYGLNMLRMSDLIMDLLAHLHDWSLDDLVNILLPFLALEKYRRVRRYPFGQFHGNSLETLDDYQRRPRLTHYFRLDDVTPTSSGVVALVLSRDPRGPRRTVEIIGMGQGYVPASLSARRGDPTVVAAIRDALARSTQEAGVSQDWLLSCDFAVIHDAFPSIEYFFLKELGLGPIDIAKRLVSGWSNPFGGLKGCGHALGASGLLQVAKSFQVFTQDPTYITSGPIKSPYPDLVTSAPFDTAFTTSVGGVLTNIVVTLLRAHSEDESQPNAWPRPPSQVRRKAPSEWPAARTDTDDKGPLRVLARTHLIHTPTFGDDFVALTAYVRNPWVYLLDRPEDEGAEKPLAFARSRFPVGALVKVVTRNFDGTDYLEVVDQIGDEQPQGYTACHIDRERVEGLIELERKFQEQGHRLRPLQFIPPRECGPFLCYTERDAGDGWTASRARVIDASIGRPMGHRVAVHRLVASDGAGLAEIWRDRASIVHPALSEIVDISHDDAQLQVVTDLHEGTRLADWLDGHALKRDVAIEWAARLAGAVAALHAHGHTHGHLAAANVRVSTRNHVRLLENPRPGHGDVSGDIAGIGLIVLALIAGVATDDVAEARHRADVLCRTMPSRGESAEAIAARCLRVAGTRPFVTASAVAQALAKLGPGP